MKPRNERISKTLFIRFDQLMDDISTQIDAVADMRTNQDGSQNQKLLNASSRYAPMLQRWIDKYLNLAKSRMAAYVMTMDRRAAMNATRPWDEVIVNLEFPVSWNETTFVNLVDAVHQYIVNSVLKELFILWFTSNDPLTADKANLADDAYIEIKHCLVSQKPGFARKTLNPF